MNIKPYSKNKKVSRILQLQFAINDEERTYAFQTANNDILLLRLDEDYRKIDIFKYDNGKEIKLQGSYEVEEQDERIEKGEPPSFSYLLKRIETPEEYRGEGLATEAIKMFRDFEIKPIWARNLFDLRKYDDGSHLLPEGRAFIERMDRLGYLTYQNKEVPYKDEWQ